MFPQLLQLQFYQEFGDSARAKKLYEEDSDAEDEVENVPNAKLAAGELIKTQAKQL